MEMGVEKSGHAGFQDDTSHYRIVMRADRQGGGAKRFPRSTATRSAGRSVSRPGNRNGLRRAAPAWATVVEPGATHARGVEHGPFQSASDELT